MLQTKAARLQRHLYTQSTAHQALLACTRESDATFGFMLSELRAAKSQLGTRAGEIGNLKGRLTQSRAS